MLIKLKFKNQLETKLSIISFNILTLLLFRLSNQHLLQGKKVIENDKKYFISDIDEWINMKSYFINSYNN